MRDFAECEVLRTRLWYHSRKKCMQINKTKAPNCTSAQCREGDTK